MTCAKAEISFQVIGLDLVYRRVVRVLYQLDATKTVLLVVI